jgi:2-polyprenyl-3-methyl-5-hydroxy-6-metoxy-1,4-benzoquinol methylase
MIKKDENMKWGEGEKQKKKKKKKITYIPLSQWGKHRDKSCNKTLWD